MSYTVWMDGTKLGDTALEISDGRDQRAGVFHPTGPGLAVLPGITAMCPALLDAGRMCRERGIDTEDPDLDVESATDRVFETPEGDRIRQAARLIARLELHGPHGELVPWETLLISDVNELVALAGSLPRTMACDGGPRVADIPPSVGETSDPIRYLISARLRTPHRAGTLTRRPRGAPMH